MLNEDLYDAINKSTEEIALNFAIFSAKPLRQIADEVVQKGHLPNLTDDGFYELGRQVARMFNPGAASRTNHFLMGFHSWCAVCETKLAAAANWCSRAYSLELGHSFAQIQESIERQAKERHFTFTLDTEVTPDKFLFSQPAEKRWEPVSLLLPGTRLKMEEIGPLLDKSTYTLLMAIRYPQVLQDFSIFAPCSPATPESSLKDHGLMIFGNNKKRKVTVKTVKLQEHCIEPDTNLILAVGKNRHAATISPELGGYPPAKIEAS